MPTRILRDGILTSELVAKLNWAEEVFYRRLMSVTDDHGRFYANPMLLRASCYPLHLDKVSDVDVGKWLTSCVTAGLVSVYPASDGKRYLQIERFNQRVQSKSKFPAPDGSLRDSTVVHGEPPESTALVGDGVVVEGGNRRKTSRSVKTTLPDDFGLTAELEAWAAKKGYTRLPEHLEAFKAKAKAKGYTYADWHSAFQEAVREDWANLRVSSGNPPQSTAANRRLA